MIYYIADTHFGHNNIISLCNRPFNSVADMNQVLIDNWNNTVKDSDDIYIIGDLFFKKCDYKDILNKLKGNKHLIMGNHDVSWLDDELREYFVSIDNYLEIHDSNHRIVLSHYPMLAYHRQSKAYMIHGHIHNDTLFDYWHVLVKRERILNAGVDINGFKPVSFAELLNNNQRYKEKMLKMYPCSLLSLRFNIDYLRVINLDKQRLLDVLEPLFNEYNITLIYEGLYLINDITKAYTMIEKFNIKIKESNNMSKIFKNFDIVEVNSDGTFKVIKK